MQILSVIQCRSDVGIITNIEGNKFRIMFETINNGVEFRWYQQSYVHKMYRVVG